MGWVSVIILYLGDLGWMLFCSHTENFTTQCRAGEGEHDEYSRTPGEWQNGKRKLMHT